MILGRKRLCLLQLLLIYIEQTPCEHKTALRSDEYFGAHSRSGLFYARRDS